MPSSIQASGIRKLTVTQRFPAVAVIVQPPLNGDGDLRFRASFGFNFGGVVVDEVTSPVEETGLAGLVASSDTALFDLDLALGRSG